MAQSAMTAVLPVDLLAVVRRPESPVGRAGRGGPRGDDVAVAREEAQAAGREEKDWRQKDAELTPQVSWVVP